MRLGVIGAGTMSKLHLEACRRVGVSVVAIADRSREGAEARAAEFGISRVYTDASALFADSEVDAVIIATPVSTHTPLVIEALAAKKHVLCEKPPAMSAAEIETMIEARNASGMVLLFGFVRRYDPRIRALRERYLAGDFGRLLFGEAQRLARLSFPGGWFSDRRYTKGGSFFDAAIHEVDALLYILGYPALRSVRAYLDRENSDLAVRLDAVGRGYASASRGDFRNDVETSATVFAETCDGTPLLFRATAATPTVNEGALIRLTGSRLGASVDPTDAKTCALGEDGFTEDELTEKANNLDAQLRHFVDCVENGAAPVASAEDALALLRFYDAVYLSGEEKREVLL